MSMSHKAYAFDWAAFEQRLRPVLEAALSNGDSEALLSFVEGQRASITDPYEGEPLGDNWKDQLERADAHEVGDYALTLCYRPPDDFGLGEQWLEIEALLSERARHALLGEAIGPAHNLFDPGKMGSYFQSPDQCSSSLSVLESEGPEVPLEYLTGLRQAVSLNMGLYVTF